MTAAAVTARSVPTAQSPSAPQTSSASRVASTPVRQTTVAQAIKTVAPKPEEASTPSPEFLKWMRDSLRGLNSSVQCKHSLLTSSPYPVD